MNKAEISQRDLDWLSGILEGEGCFYLSHKSCPTITINMIDKDIIDRIAKLFKRDFNEIEWKKKRNIGKIQYRTATYSVEAIQFMELLYPLMGKRRQKRIKSILHAAKKLTLRGRNDGRSKH